MFWENLTSPEQDEYRHLSVLIASYVAWAGLKRKIRDITPKPYEPTNIEFIRHDKLAAKGWKEVI